MTRALDEAGSGARDVTAAERAVSEGASDIGRDSRVGGDAPPEAETPSGTPCAAYSFSAGTRVATPQGERPIGSLKVGDTVEAYNPTTGKAEAEPIQAIFVHHDTDLVDVRLTPAGIAPTSQADRRVTVRMLRDSDTFASDNTAPTALDSVGAGETIHTTANHPG